MGPRDSRDLTEVTGDVHPMGKGKRKAKISRTRSNASLGDLTPDAVDTGIAAVRQICKILRFVQSYHEEISDIDSIYGLGIQQQAQIDELETTVTKLAFRKDQELAKFQDENDAYRANAHHFEREKEKLELEQASMDDTRKAMRLEVEIKKEKEINKAKQQISDEARATVKKIREELEKKIAADI